VDLLGSIFVCIKINFIKLARNKRMIVKNHLQLNCCTDSRSNFTGPFPNVTKSSSMWRHQSYSFSTIEWRQFHFDLYVSLDL